VNTQAVICVDVASNTAAVPGAPCPVGQGLTTITVSVPDNGQVFDPAQAGEFFFFGFGVVVFGYLVGFAVAQVRKPIRG
jgi:hypothetical protein